MIQYKCPKCGVLLESPSSLTGQHEECPFCHSQVPVPSAPAFRRRWLLWGGGIAAVLVVAGCVLLAFWLFGKEDPPKSDESWAVEEEATPKFGATTREPVLLRYRFEPGDKFEATVDLSIIMNIQAEAQFIHIPTLMQMDISCEVENVAADGNAQINVVFSRIAIKAKGPGGSLRYDSDVDKNPPDKNLRYIAAMLNQKVPCMVTPRGELSDVNLHFMRDAMDRAGAAAMFNEVEKTVNQSLQGAFIQLAGKPVSAGDVYDAGEITRTMGGAGAMTCTVRYEVLSVSEDKRNVLLKPIVQFDTNSLHGSRFCIDSAEMDGWILFNRDRGNIDRSYGKVTLEMSVSEGGQEATVNAEIVMKYLTMYGQATEVRKQP